ncbi:hypothetical protein HZP25_15710 [Elizabethkingia anophelis]|nr:hypothetical protein [Elizabethkingia anophelis]
MICAQLNKFLAVVFVLESLMFAYAQDSKWALQAGVGFSFQSMRWSVAGNQQGTDPNILSEVIWDKLNGTAYNMKADYNISQKMGFAFLINYSNISKGSGNDSDYAEDNRNGKFTHINFSINNGYIYNFQLKTNYKFPKLLFLLPYISMGFEGLDKNSICRILPVEILC